MVTAAMTLKTFAPWKKSYDKPREHIKKQRHHFANQSPHNQSYGFFSSHIQMRELYIKKAEHWRTDAFKLRCWIRLLRVPWTARRSNQLILKEINPEYLLVGLMRKLQYFGHLMQWADSLEKTLMLGRTEGRRRRGTEVEMVRWHHQVNGHEFEWTPGVGDGQGGLTCCSP